MLHKHIEWTGKRVRGMKKWGWIKGAELKATVTVHTSHQAAAPLTETFPSLQWASFILDNNADLQNITSTHSYLYVSLLPMLTFTNSCLKKSIYFICRDSQNSLKPFLTSHSAKTSNSSMDSAAWSSSWLNNALMATSTLGSSAWNSLWKETIILTDKSRKGKGKR